jgi:histidine phosphotransferase ChpT
MSDYHPDEIELAALLCSKVCHDVISPVGAIVNGIEVLDEDDEDEQMASFAMDLIRKSAMLASAKLQFARLAYGAAGSAGAEIDLSEAAAVARSYINDDKVTLEWQAPARTMGKNYVKLLLNMIVTAKQAIPRGGNINVAISEDFDSPGFMLRSSGFGARVPAGIMELISGELTQQLEARAVQPYYMGLVARRSNMDVVVHEDGGDILVSALALD